MARYMIRPTPQAHGWFDPEPMIPAICAPDAVPVDTGLLDANGNEIWRAPNPMGFGRDEEWS